MRESTRTKSSGRKKTGRRKKHRILKGLLLIVIILGVVYGGYRLYGMVDDHIYALRSEIMRRQYPVKYEAIVEKYSDNYDLDKYLVYAVIRTESKFDRTALSGSGAYGLMQIREDTAGDCAKKIDMDVNLPEDLYDPDTNIHLGTYYLSWLLKRYDGDIPVAVAAYNGGIGNVDEWLANSDYSDGNGGLGEIPFPETADYVKGVNQSYEKYRELYEKREQ